MPSMESSPSGALALHYAAARGCLDCARLLVDTRTGLTANTQMENEVTPVYLAAQEGHLEVLKFLVLEAGGSLYIRAKDGMAPVHAAAQMGALTCLKWMVEEQGVDPNLRDGDGATPLHFAASRGHVDCVTWLLRHGAALHQDNYGKSPINDAAENQQMQCLNVLIQHGTSPDYSEEDRIYGRFHGCTCRVSDPTSRCSYADCVNYVEPREPFYLHTKENLYMTPVDRLGQDPFYLHRPGDETGAGGYHRVRQLFGTVKVGPGRREEIPSVPPPPPPIPLNTTTGQFYLHRPGDETGAEGYHRVRQLFGTVKVGQGRREEIPSVPPPPLPIPLNTTTVTVDVHKSDDHDKDTLSVGGSSSRGGDQSEDALSYSSAKDQQSPGTSPDLSELPSLLEVQHPPTPVTPSKKEKDITLLEDHEYEDIYSVRGRDSGSHSRSGSLSSASSHLVVSDSPESGVSSPSPSELGKSESETDNEKSKLELRHSLPHQSQNGSRALKRVVSVPSNICPPPPPPPPPEDSISTSSLSGISPLSSLPASRSSSKESTLQQHNDATASQIGHLVNKQMVLPFIPPKFVSPIDPDGLIKPSEYLRSLQGGTGAPNSPPTAPEGGPPSPPAPPLPPPPPPQPLSTISVQDITSVQLKRTKPQAGKTMSCPPVSLTGAPESPFQTQKEDLIAELKMSKDIIGIKKLKVERVKMEEKVGKEIEKEISKQFSVDQFVEKMPEKDSAGNPIPPWKRQMLAKKAAEKAKKELEEQLAREAEQKRLQSIPAWKRHLLQKKGPAPPIPNGNSSIDGDNNNKTKHQQLQEVVVAKREVSVQQEPPPDNKENSLPEPRAQEKKEEDAEVIIPWRAQLRKTNSTLNLLE